MRIFITGGAGCLGSNLTERYLERGDEVFVLDNFVTGHRGSLPEGRAGLTVVEGSVAEATLVSKLIAEFRPSHVIHSAASYKDPQDWIGDSRVNVEGTINVIRAAEALGVKRFVNFHTALGYGRPDTIPIAVDAPARPFTSYGISKQAGENYLAISNLHSVSLRLANVTGPRLAIGPIPTFYARLKADKPCFCSKTIRDFVDMEDFFSVMDLVMKEDAPTGVFNVSTGTGHTIKEIFELVALHLGVKLDAPVAEVEPGPDDIVAVVLDPTKTQQVLGWRAAYDFKAIIQRMLEWYDLHGVTAVFSHLKPPAGERSKVSLTRAV